MHHMCSFLLAFAPLFVVLSGCGSHADEGSPPPQSTTGSIGQDTEKNSAREESRFEFTVTGDLVGKLEPDTRVVIWSGVIETKPNWARFSVKDMPASVPYKQLAAEHIWIASFISPAQRRTVFSIGLARELFDKPRRIDLKLDRPTPHTTVRFGQTAIPVLRGHHPANVV